MSAPFIAYPSRRSVVHSTNGIVSCTQPLAAQAGLKILRDGGNAADAAVAVAAALSVTEPTSTAIGGDLFCLFYDAKTKKVRGLNASGRSPAALTRELAMEKLGFTEEIIEQKPFTRIPMHSALSVTVPGAAAGWVDTVEKFGSGKLGMKDILAEPIRLAEEGFPVSELSASFWQDCEDALRVNREEMLKNGKAPATGEIMKLKELASTFKELAEKGKKGFYEGRIAEEIVKAIQEDGGVMTLEDLKKHGETGSEEVQPINLDWHGKKVWECPPNGQGMVALMSLGVIEAMQERGVIPKLGQAGNSGYAHNSTEYLHAVIEALRIAFSDGHWWVSDPSHTEIPVTEMLSKEYLQERSKEFSADKVNEKIQRGSPAMSSCDTVYFSVVDQEGNGCSFINSTFGGFGSGIIPKGTGIILQNRGSGFSFRAKSPNFLAPGKRPYHTIIPGLITKNDELEAVFGCMGGFMQPQGQLQILLNIYVWGMNPQQALDAPRICVGKNYDPNEAEVALEEGIGEDVAEGLRKLGHRVEVVKGWDRGRFGRGQFVAVRHTEDGRVYSAGSDLRGDGHAIGW